VVHNSTLCGACLTRPTPAPVQRCVATLDYGYPWDGLIARWKFGGEAGWSGLWADLMLRDAQVLPMLQASHLLVPVPVGPSRLADRGFNQAWELGSALLRRTTPPHPRSLADALVRVRDTPDQHSLPRAQRLQNLRGAFAAHPQHGSVVAGAQVLLVDDVSTTGATLEAAAQALLDGGAASVQALVLARTPPREEKALP
jgi:ComF family protein